MPFNIEKELLIFISNLSERGILTKKEAGNLEFFVENYASFQEKIGRTKKDVYMEIGAKIADKLLENIVEKKGGKFLDEKILNLLKEIPDIKLRELKGLKSSELSREKLFQIAVFGLTPEKLITTGYLKAKPEDPYFPSNLLISLINLGSLFDKSNFRDIIIGHVQKLYGLKGELYPFEGSVTEEERDEFYLKLKWLLFKVKWSFHEDVENLRDSLTFYNRSLGLYIPASENINIFSTSSGIVIPEEYRGDVKTEKNPYRRKYFDEGIAAKNAYDLPKHYQWDSEGTAINLWKRHVERDRSEEYKNEAIEVLAKFLQTPHLEITEAPFKHEPWKEFFTLVTQKTYVLSERGDIRKINHGIMINDDVLKTNKEIYEEIAGLLGKKDNGIIRNIKSIYKRGECRTFKRIDEICATSIEAREKARDIVEILLQRGQNLFKKAHQIKSQCQ